MKKKSAVGLLLATTVLFGTQAVVAAPDPTYPILDAKQLGALRNTVALAQQPNGDWTDMRPGPRGAFDDFQFQLAWMHYGLAVAQAQLTPAYREPYKAASQRIIEKMLQNEAWEHWDEILKNPRFAKYVEPSMDLRDPVKIKNIMYSGHLLQMIGLHEKLYNDHRYDQAGSIKFSKPGLGGFSHSYNHADLAKIIHDQFVESKFIGIECEPNFVFAECNQHPVLGLISYDRLHGADLANVKEAFWKKAEELGFLNPNTRRFAGPYMIKEVELNKSPTVWNDGWTGVSMHGWDKTLVNQVYPAQRDAVLRDLISASPNVVKQRWAGTTVSTDFGFLAAYAAEVGDQATRKTLLDYADANLKPIWKKDRYFYPRHDVPLAAPAQNVSGTEAPSIGGASAAAPSLPDDKLNERLVNTLTGNALLAFARLNTGDGFWNLYNRLEASYVENGPELVGVDYPRVLVNQAYFDRASRVLAIGVLPATEYRGNVGFQIHNLPRNVTYDFVVDGSVRGTISGAKIDVKGPDLSVKWNVSGDLNIQLPLQEGRAILVKQRPGAVASR